MGWHRERGGTSTAPSTLHPPAFKHSTAILSLHPVMVRRVLTCGPQGMWRPVALKPSIMEGRSHLLFLAPVEPVHRRLGRPTLSLCRVELEDGHVFVRSCFNRFAP